MTPELEDVQADAAQLAALQEHANEVAPVVAQVCTGYRWTAAHEFVRIMGEPRYATSKD